MAHVCYAGSRYKALVESIKDKECSASDVVGADEISSVVSRWTGIPLERLPQTGILHMFKKTGGGEGRGEDWRIVLRAT